MLFFKSLIACVLVVAAVAEKLNRDKVIKRGIVEQRMFYNEYSMEDYNVREIVRTPLGECHPHWDKEGKRVSLQVQTFKNSDVVELQEQIFSDRHCMKRVGKANKLDRFHNMKMVHSKSGMHFQKSFFKQGAAPITWPGLIMNTHADEHCNPKMAPLGSHFVASYTCTNNTISDNPHAKSMMNYAEYGYVYEYSEPNCWGNSSMVYLPDPMHNCWQMGPMSMSFQVNHYVSPVYPTEPPVMPPTFPPVGNPSYSVNGTVAQGEYFNVRIPATSAGMVSLMSAMGDADLYVNFGPYYPAGSAVWSMGASPSSEMPVMVSPMCNEGAECMYYISVYGYASFSAFTLEFFPTM